MKFFGKNEVGILNHQKRWITIAYENQQNWRLGCSEVRLTLKMGRFGHRHSGSPKNSWTIAHANQQNEGLTYSRDRLTFKMVCFGREGQLITKKDGELYQMKKILGFLAKCQ
ncbi:hypothetical protein H5410_058792 [Solanum commersonii]|uniref:Uncharacterized protein n=1 Tax=Solanum commersonii TaxID=4109 RepID=A0A9J5WSJ4_SOLCO|nr:hypothetical protein H5410_058792 [Solanum commersonii]